MAITDDSDKVYSYIEIDPIYCGACNTYELPSVISQGELKKLFSLQKIFGS